MWILCAFSEFDTNEQQHNIASVQNLHTPPLLKYHYVPADCSLFSNSWLHVMNLPRGYATMCMFVKRVALFVHIGIVLFSVKLDIVKQYQHTTDNHFHFSPRARTTSFHKTFCSSIHSQGALDYCTEVLFFEEKRNVSAKFQHFRKRPTRIATDTFSIASQLDATQFMNAFDSSRY